jgi:hypothetical protein
MTTDLGVGDVEVAFVDVAPSDTDTVGVLTVRPPSPATSFTITATAAAPVAVPNTSPVEYSRRLYADQPITYNAPGLWVLHWDITGTGESSEDFEVYVVASPTAGGPTWLPGRSRVANYVTHRTLARNPAAIRNSQSSLALTFDSTTTPTGLQVDRLIADGGAWVAMRAAPLAATLYDAAAVVVALYCAAAIERQFKADEQSLQRANDMEKRMDSLMQDLVDANNATGGTGDYGLEVAPAWSFPPADCRWDYSGYF